MKTPKKYLSLTEAAERLEISQATIKADPPEPDALIGNRRGWLPETLEEWNEARPGQGYRTDLHGEK